jgi:hypothetical protein
MNRSKATEHRVLVLEEVATAPEGATIKSTTSALSNETFPYHSVWNMVWQLRKEGLLGMGEEGYLHLTEFGLRYLQQTDFTRALPEFAERPKARKPRRKE